MDATSLMVLLGLLVGGLLLHVLLRPGRREAPGRQAGTGRGAVSSAPARVAQLGHEDPEVAEDAARALWSTGPGVVPELLGALGALEQDPRALTPAAQLRVEQVLSGFGLHTWLLLMAPPRPIHRVSPVFPAVVRVQVGVGPHLVGQMIGGALVPELATPILARLGAPALERLAEELALRPEGVDERLLAAALPLIAAHPDWLPRVAFGLPTPGRRALLAATLPWPLAARRALTTRALDDDDPEVVALAVEERAVQLLASSPERALGGALVALVRRGLEVGGEARRRGLALLTALSPEHALGELPPGQLSDAGASEEAARVAELLARADGDLRPAVEAAMALTERAAPSLRRAGVRALGAMLTDPRAVERLLLLGEDVEDPLGALAVVALIRGGVAPAQGLLSTRVRAAGTDPEERFLLRLGVAMGGQPFVPALARLMRVESPRTAALAARLLAPLAPPLDAVLKALGRHRYSPIEATIAPLLYARWPQLGDQVQAALGSDDREVLHAAIWLIAALGDAHQGDALLGVLEREPELVEPVLGAIELLGPRMAGPLGRFSARHPELRRNAAVARGVELLQALGQDAPATSARAARASHLRPD